MILEVHSYDEMGASDAVVLCDAFARVRTRKELSQASLSLWVKASEKQLFAEHVMEQRAGIL